MPVVETRSVLSGIPVSEAMRRQVINLPISVDIGQGIRFMIRYKANAVLLTDDNVPCGVVSKTDLMSALYAELPIETPLGDVMGSQPIACFPDDPVEDALEMMEAAGVHRLYVTGANREEVIGTVAYSEIVGLLYRYCRACERGTTKKGVRLSGIDPSARLTVEEVMTQDVWACRDNDSLFTVIEILSAHNMSAVLVQNEVQSSVGVISKTDLIVAYHHGMSPGTEAREIMNTPVHSVPAEELLSKAIQQMLVMDVQRLFVCSDASNPDQYGGVIEEIRDTGGVSHETKLA
ncbi:MAG: CBS domain-containing protein, partial [Deltaproteobacteria bacterium]|nr:CBS domain-containing protein [Deltaproteobacteria bacterium]